MNTEELDALVSRYLDKDLSVDEARQFESELSRPEVQRLLNEELLIRQTFATLPEPPFGLCTRVSAALGVASSAPQTKVARRAVSKTQAVLSGVSLSVRGPAAAMALSSSTGLWSARGTVAGLRMARFALGPLLRSSDPKPVKPKPRSLWRSAASLVWGR